MNKLNRHALFSKLFCRYRCYVIIPRMITSRIRPLYIELLPLITYVNDSAVSLYMLLYRKISHLRIIENVAGMTCKKFIRKQVVTDKNRDNTNEQSLSPIRIKI